MSRVNFIEQFNLFMEYARENYIHGRESMLWMALFYFANRKAQYDEQSQTYEWPDDFFSVSNAELNAYGQFDKRAIETLRNNLKQRGLIDFMKGQKNKKNPAYKMFYLMRVGSKIVPNSPISANVGSKKAPNNNGGTVIGRENAPNYAPNNVPNSVPNHAPNCDPKNGILGTEMLPTMPPKNINVIYKNINADAGVNYSAARAKAQSAGLVDLGEEMNGTDGLVPLAGSERRW